MNNIKCLLAVFLFFSGMAIAHERIDKKASDVTTSASSSKCSIEDVSGCRW